MSGDRQETNHLVRDQRTRGFLPTLQRYFTNGCRFTRDGLPSSNPINWPDSTPEDINDRPKRVVKIGSPQIFSFRDNNIKTSKYEVYNFLPKFLLEEFNPYTKMANCYFLFIAGLQCIPSISNTGGIPTTMVPLLVVVMVDAIFQIFEDITRHRADMKANSSTTQKYKWAEFHSVHWSEVKVGDIVKVNNREMIPADLVILAVAEPIPDLAKGICYVETKSLDGETNLKIRMALPLTRAKSSNVSSSLSSFTGEIEMEHPNKLIDSFQGVIELTPLVSSDTGGREVIQTNNVLLRGCVLRNTEYIYGLVVNTGHDTKVMMSNSLTKVKVSRLEKKTSQQVSRIILVLMFLCFWGATGQALWNSVYQASYRLKYLQWSNYSSISTWFIDFFYFFLLHATFIPVSLYVSMSMTRYFQSYFMNKDLEMYDAKTDSPALVRTMTLNEELGQISHVFSDKTGTLTCNIMDFRKMSINGVSYGQGITEIGKAAWKLQGKSIPFVALDGEMKAQANAVPHVAFYCPKYTKDIAAFEDNESELDDEDDEEEDEKVAQRKNSQRIQIDKIHFFFRSLSICHDIIAEADPKAASGIKYSASNPDDEALVCAAKFFGFEFLDRRDNICLIKNKTATVNKAAGSKAAGKGAAEGQQIGEGIEEEVEVLLTIPFTSKRKRMSVIVKERNNSDSSGSSSIRILCKGADTAMIPRLKGGQEALLATTIRHVEDYSVEGLRCLYVGAANVKEKDYYKWRTDYDAASTNLTEMAKKSRGEKNKIEELENVIEQSMYLLGATAIEDKLQEGVPQCIFELVKAGTIIWVLTGDKEETAINIAVACNLLQPTSYMEHVIINHTIAPDVTALRNILLSETQRYENDLVSEDTSFKPRALIIDGPSLLLITGATSSDSLTFTLMAAAGSAKQPLIPGKEAATADKEGSEVSLKDLLLDFSLRCKAVIGCRVSPDQKKEMVKLVKEGVPNARTLAIGDGANDVAMIQEAHIGVGIRGEEGTQAVNSADYAIGQFKFLGELMLKHGRYNYLRLANVICYMFYKNILMSMGMFWYNFNCGFSGLKYYTEGSIQLYNLAYTSIPIILYAIYDRDVSGETMHNYPQLYSSAVNDDNFSDYVFWSWLAAAFVESIIMSVLPLFTLENMSANNGMEDAFQEPGMTCLTAIVIVVNIKIFFIQSRWYWFTAVATLGSLVVYICSLYFISAFAFLDNYFYSLWNRLISYPSFWLTIFLLVVIVYAKDVYLAGLERSFNFKPIHILQEVEAVNRDHRVPRKISNDYVNSSSAGATAGAASGTAPVAATSAVTSSGVAVSSGGGGDIEMLGGEVGGFAKDNQNGYRPVAATTTTGDIPIKTKRGKRIQ